MKKKINISDKVLNIINVEQIKPVSKWEFAIKNWGLWLGLGTCLILLILGVSVSWFGVIDNIIVPYLWLVLTSIFLFLSYIVFEKTRNAYHYEKWQVIVFIMALGIVAGGILFKIGLARGIDKNLETNLPYYRQAVPMKLEVWNNPNEGYLSGVVTKVINSNYFEIEDFSGKKWIITGQKPVVRGKVILQIGEEIKLIGEIGKGNSFVVKEIRPWVGTGKMMNKK